MRHTRGFTPPFGRVIKLLRSCYRMPLDRRGAHGLQLRAGDGEVSRSRGLELPHLARSVPARCNCPGSCRPEQPALSANTPSSFKRFWESLRADSNRLPLLQLRVCGRALQGFARGCNSRISKQLSLLRLAAHCTVLRSRWYQSDIRRLWITQCRFFWTSDPQPEHSMPTPCAVKDRKRPAATGSPDSVSRLYCAWITRFLSPYLDLEVNPG